MNIEELKESFKNHVENYDMNDSMIKLKYYHSFRVMELCREIAEVEGLNLEDTYLAMVIGLLHDYARFEQWSKYKTSSDINSVDHGDLACELLFDNNEIDKFNIDNKYYNVIYEAIKYHNKYSYPKVSDDRTKYFCKLIKDADKLDILYLCSYGDIPLPTDNSEISDKILADFNKKKLLNKKDSKNINDEILIKLALIFDLNFEYSFEYVKNNMILDNMLNKIEDKNKFKSYFDYVNKYIEERSK